MKKIFYTTFFFEIIFCAISFAQNINPIAFDLSSPVDVNLDNEGISWVTESGTGINDGKILKVSPNGTKEYIIENLPSYFNTAEQELKGALSTIAMSDGRIFVCQGEGVDTLSAMILEFHWDDYINKGAPLVPGDQRSVIKHGEWVLSNGFNHSNPYSFIIDENENFIISDAAANAIFKYTIATEEYEVLVEFPPFKNPTPVGPPFIDAVPTKILAHPDGGYLVCTLTGFPFLDGAANIYHVQDDGSMTLYASDLTLLTDMAFDPNDNKLIALQFATFGEVDNSFSFLFNSAQLIKIGDSGQLDTLVSGFGPSAGLALAEDGSAYLTHLFLGQLLKSDPISTGLINLEKQAITELAVYPNPNEGRFKVELNLKAKSTVHFVLTDMIGREINSGLLRGLSSGENKITIDFTPKNIESGIYQLSLNTGTRLFISKIIFQ